MFLKKLKDFIIRLLKKHFADAFYITFPRVIITLVGLISLPIVLVSLSPDDYGKYQFVLGLEAWLLVVTGGYITTGAKRGIARGLEGTFLYAFLKRLKLLAIVSPIALLASFYLYFIGSVTLSLLLGTVSLFIVFGYLFQVSFCEFFVAKKQFKSSAVWRIILSVFSIGISTLAVYLTNDILIFTITRLGSTAVVSWAGWLYVMKKNNLFLEYKKGKIDKNCVSYGKKLIPADIILAAANKLANFIIGPFFGFANLAVFSVADGICEEFRGFMAITQSLFYSDFAKNEQESLVRILKGRIKQITAVSVIIMLGCIVVGFCYINLFLPDLYHKAIIYFLILSLGLPAIILELLMRTVLEVNFKHKELTTLIVFPNIAKILFILVLGLFFGVVGVCWGIVFGSWFSFVLYYVLTIKKDSVMNFFNYIKWMK